MLNLVTKHLSDLSRILMKGLSFKLSTKNGYLFRNLFCFDSFKCSSSNVKDSMSDCSNRGAPRFDQSKRYLNSLKVDEVFPVISKDEYVNRRSNLVEGISQFISSHTSSKNNIIIIPSACKQYMSDKIPYFFRQDTEFLYLTGCLESDSCLVLSSDGSEMQSILFVPDKNHHSELWDGPRINPSDVKESFGIDKGLPMSELESYLKLHFKSNNAVHLWYDLSSKQTKIDNIVRDLSKKTRSLESPKLFLNNLRLIKSTAEIELMKKSCQIASDAIMKTMEYSSPGDTEHVLFAKVDYECRIRGAQHLAYPPVVAGGTRANIIHYIKNNQIIGDGDLILMDAGCEFFGYSSDITRTWPINGKFTKSQKDLYEIVLETQTEIIELLKKFPSVDTLFHSMCHLQGKKLQQIGIIPKIVSKEVLMKTAYKFCPHHVSHYLGMDVHDTPLISKNIPVKPGMIITVEPGVYIREDDDTVPKEFRGIGIRIEDDVLITENGPEVLTKNCLKKVDAIEKVTSKTSK